MRWPKHSITPANFSPDIGIEDQDHEHRYDRTAAGSGTIACRRGCASPCQDLQHLPDELARLSDDVVAALKTVYDPEIPADIFELGLIYKIDIEDDRMVKIVMTLTAPVAPLPEKCRAGWKTRLAPSRAYPA